MQRQTDNRQLIKYVCVGFIVVCAFAMVIWSETNNNHTITGTLDREKLRNESLLAEKLDVEKRLDKSKQELSSITEKQSVLEQERLSLLSANKQQKQSIALAKQKIDRALHENRRLHHIIDSMKMQAWTMDEQVKREKEQLMDSIFYLQELNKTLSAELDYRQNQ
jgi:septal ring factor EnvC (AmiA/AmiB activator)